VVARERGRHGKLNRLDIMRIFFEVFADILRRRLARDGGVDGPAVYHQARR
jgi:hypothetical protein